MAYMNQDRKASLVAAAKKVLKKYGVKATFSTDRSSIYCNIKSSGIDFIGNYNQQMNKHAFMYGKEAEDLIAKDYIQVNPYHYNSHFTGKAQNFLHELHIALNKGNHDNSDTQTDYFDIGWYVHVNIGKWDKPYALAA